jgi:hypothetical protein
MSHSFRLRQRDPKWAIRDGRWARSGLVILREPKRPKDLPGVFHHGGAESTETFEPEERKQSPPLPPCLRGEFVMAVVEPRDRLGFRSDPVRSACRQGWIGGETGCDRKSGGPVEGSEGGASGEFGDGSRERGVKSGRESRAANPDPARPDRRTFLGKFLVGTGLFGDSQCRPTGVISSGGGHTNKEYATKA